MHVAVSNLRPGRKLYIVKALVDNPKTYIARADVIEGPGPGRSDSAIVALHGLPTTLFLDHIGLAPSKRYAGGVFFTRYQAKKFAARHRRAELHAMAQNRRDVRKKVSQVVGAL
jgi:hypothetical protein